MNDSEKIAAIKKVIESKDIKILEDVGQMMLDIINIVYEM